MDVRRQPVSVGGRGMNWNPSVTVEGDRDSVWVSASDVESTSPCGQFLSLKVRRHAYVSGWRRLWAARTVPDRFALKHVRDIVRSLGSPIVHSPSEIGAAIARAFDSRPVVRQLRPWVEHAVWNVVDARDSIEATSGPLHLIKSDPEVGQQGRSLSVWADVYDGDNGLRQVHRLRVKSAHPAAFDGVDPWSATAAGIAATIRGRAAPARIQVVEIGLLDGSTAVTFDGDVAAAKAAYACYGQPRARALCDADHVQASRSCGDCKAAGVCPGLLDLDGFLGQDSRGVESRAVSPTDLRTYQACPAQWMMTAAGVPREDTGSPAADRGRAVHTWLRAAHARGVPCTAADLPSTLGRAMIGTETLNREDYAVARPFLMRHVGCCPLAAVPSPRVLAIEESLRGYDHDAEVVVALAPDLVYSDGSSLILREVKTTEMPPGSANEAFDAHLQVPFALRALASGLAEHHGFDRGVVELEVLTVDDARVWSWSTDDDETMMLAESQLETVAEPWHNDTDWLTTPSPACTWCPVRRWCLDRDVWANGLGTLPGSGAASAATF
ncbi:PD-(D/E)XK nuclease family protein [Cellulomonas cellasea]|uniref:PD-(D/E)XK nuclease family protein n=1 Tax=Cellulomonas cellasea TaxID=43670 RepID=UPI0025A3DDBB|nr:PD-(D/E)XK nuclease family protein [Cellulomonas cellasea]MDM8085132.1 PD-(D/E)XK nuclease family protein [Cellulomonas cellasea]